MFDSLFSFLEKLAVLEKENKNTLAGILQAIEALNQDKSGLLPPPVNFSGGGGFFGFGKFVYFLGPILVGAAALLFPFFPGFSIFLYAGCAIFRVYSFFHGGILGFVLGGVTFAGIVFAGWNRVMIPVIGAVSFVKAGFLRFIHFFRFGEKQLTPRSTELEGRLHEVFPGARIDAPGLNVRVPVASPSTPIQLYPRGPSSGGVPVLEGGGLPPVLPVAISDGVVSGPAMEVGQIGLEVLSAGDVVGVIGAVGARVVTQSLGFILGPGPQTNLTAALVVGAGRVLLSTFFGL